MRTATIPVLGMTCASCVATIEGALNNLNGVEKATVNLAGGKANVAYDPARVSLPQLIQAITDVGYEIDSKQVTLQVSGMTCAGCVAHVEGALSELEGVTRSVVNLGLGAAKVEYIPGLVTAAQMKRAVREVGYEAQERSAGADALDRERQARVILARVGDEIIPPDGQVTNYSVTFSQAGYETLVRWNRSFKVEAIYASEFEALDLRLPCWDWSQPNRNEEKKGALEELKARGEC